MHFGIQVFCLFGLIWVGLGDYANDEQDLPLLDSLVIKPEDRVPFDNDPDDEEEYSNDEKPYNKDPSSDYFDEDSSVIGERACDMVKCFIQNDTSGNKKKLECLSRLPHNKKKILFELECRYWIEPKVQNYAQRYRRGVDGEKTNIRVILRTDNYTEKFSDKLKQRITVDEIEKNALYRLLELIASKLNLSIKQRKQTTFSLTLSYIKFLTLKRRDLAYLIKNSNLVALNLWNPEKWTDDALIPSGFKATDNTYPYFRLNIYCENGNVTPSFKRMWLPWSKWMIKMNHCGNKYVCSKWTSSEAICERNGEKEVSYTPPFYFYPTELEMSSGIQILHPDECLNEGNKEEALSELYLERSKNCWQHKSRKFEDTTTTTTSTSTTSTTTSTSTSSTTSTTTTSAPSTTLSNDKVLSLAPTKPPPPKKDTPIEPIEEENLTPSFVNPQLSQNKPPEQHKNDSTGQRSTENDSEQDKTQYEKINKSKGGNSDENSHKSASTFHAWVTDGPNVGILILIILNIIILFGFLFLCCCLARMFFGQKQHRYLSVPPCQHGGYYDSNSVVVLKNGESVMTCQTTPGSTPYHGPRFPKHKPIDYNIDNQNSSEGRAGSSTPLIQNPALSISDLELRRFYR